MTTDLRRLFGDGPIAEYAGPRAFFKTVAHPVYPTGTAYPEAGAEPNVYLARRVKNVTFVEEPGRQTLDYDLTDQYAHIFNLEPLKYIEEGSVVLCFREGGSWYTIDKVVEEKPCCGNYMFRGAFGGGLQSFDLTLEALHGWYVYSDPAADYDMPFRTQESLSSPLTLTMNYEYPIPDEFMDVEEWQYPGGRMPYDASKGWYISPTVTFMQIPGDPVYTGTSIPVTGRWYYSECELGFWFDEDRLYDYVLRIGLPVRPWMNYVGFQLPGSGGIPNGEFSPHLMPQSVNNIGVPSASRFTSTNRALRFSRFEFSTCRPLLLSMRDVWNRNRVYTPSQGVVFGPSGPAGPFWGVPAPIRFTEDELDNPMAIDLGGYAQPGSNPQHMIPPPEVEIYRGNQTIMEYFCVQFTAS